MRSFTMCRFFATLTVAAIFMTGGLASSAHAEEEAPAAYAFDAQDKPLAEVQAAAKAANKLIFIDFFLHG